MGASGGLVTSGSNTRASTTLLRGSTSGGLLTRGASVSLARSRGTTVTAIVTAIVTARLELCRVGAKRDRGPHSRCISKRVTRQALNLCLEGANDSLLLGEPLLQVSQLGKDNGGVISESHFVKLGKGELKAVKRYLDWTACLINIWRESPSNFSWADKKYKYVIFILCHKRSIRIPRYYEVIFLQQL
jgi:hypothetical protein